VGDPLNHSYYAATANAWTVQPALMGAERADVVVIGGGFTGLSAALACAEKGLSVILLEAKTIGFGASGRNGGQLIPGLRWGIRDLDAAFGRERAKAIFDLAWGAGERVRSRILKHDIVCDLKSGHLEAAYKPAHFDDMQREAEFLQTHFGWDSARVVQPEDMGNHVSGGRYHGGIYDQQGGHFHPLNYALGLAQAALAAGVRIFENTSFEGVVEHSADKIDVLTSNEINRISANRVIIATDAWMHEKAPHWGRFTIPIMNYNIATAPLPDADALLPSDAAVADSRFVLNYYRLSADKRMIFGGGEKYSQTPPADIAGFVRRHMAALFPSLSNVPIDYAWGGAVSVTMNRLPQLARKPGSGVFIAQGFSGHGALVTTLAGEILAEAMTGRMEDFNILASLPHKPFPGGRLLARPLATLGLMWFALRDRL
jgi:gamma-glutamylputrescine oxidase